jgi:hypothetical protein
VTKGGRTNRVSGGSGLWAVGSTLLLPACLHLDRLAEKEAIWQNMARAKRGLPMVSVYYRVAPEKMGQPQPVSRAQCVLVKRGQSGRRIKANQHRSAQPARMTESQSSLLSHLIRPSHAVMMKQSSQIAAVAAGLTPPPPGGGRAKKENN